tara:strand:+ start:441 stop:1226 length:786 start_codon:yes stop_codon:yes gene_type:complete
MASFLPVAPPHILKELFSNTRILHNAFYLAHEVVKDPEAYEQFKPGNDLNRNWTMNRTIMDNSVIELGNSVDFGMVKEATEITGAQVVVLPDVLLDGQGTLEASVEAYPDWAAYFSSRAELMFVPQGENMISWLRCLEQFMAMFTGNQPAWIGIARNTTRRICNSRRELVDIVSTLYPRVNIHLLGFSDYVWDDMVSAKHPAVASIDSAVPVRLANSEQLLSKEFHTFVNLSGRGNWWETAKHNEWMDFNMLKVSRMIRSV